VSEPRSVLPPSPFAGLPASIDRFIARGLAKVTGSVVAPYQSAVIRIGFSLTWFLFLLREWPHRAELYGPHAPWSFQLAKQLIASDHAFTVLLWSDSRVWFEIVYVCAMLAALSLMLGWRTRTSAVFFMIGVLSLQNRSVFVGDGGDNVIHIMAIYLIFTRCGRVWSLDSRRARRQALHAARAEDGEPGEPDEKAEAGEVVPGTDPVSGSEQGVGASDAVGVRSYAVQRDVVGVVLWIAGALMLAIACALGRLGLFWGTAFAVALGLQAVWWLLGRYAPGEPRTVMEMIANVVHAGAMLVIVVEVCFIYADAGWYKIQGSRWEDGTALYYPLHIQDFTPWPGFSHALAASGVIVMLITYGTVIVQVAFPFTLLNRRAKNTLLVLMMAEHAGIAVTLGLPFFSLAMISADSVFLPTSFLLWAGARASRAVTSRRRSAALPEQRTAGESAPSTLVG
jgi:hypothetical protein